MSWLALAVLAFLAAAGIWFAEAIDNGKLDAEQAFLGLGYFGAVVLLAMLVVACARLLTGGLRGISLGRARDLPPAEREHSIIVNQLRIGAFLILVGAVLGIVFGVLLEDGTDGVALAIGTAVIGAGAALMPPGAAAGAGERLPRPPSGSTAEGTQPVGGNETP